MSIAVKNETHDVAILERQLVTLQRRLRKIVEQDRLAELIPIWKRPGWTTPAEFFLVREALTGIDAQVRNLEKNINVAIEGSELVGAQFEG
jgi:hypothetical protein